MDLSAVVVVRKISGDKFLLVGDGKHLRLPSCLVTDADAYAAAENLLEQELCVSARIKGVHRVIQQQLKAPGNSGRISAVFVADETRSRSNLLASTQPLQWLTYTAIREQSASVDPVSLGIISQLVNGCSGLLPVELFESLDADCNRRLQKHLEKEMLVEAGYGKGELEQITDEFVKWCGSPSASMTIEEFRQVARKLGMNEASWNDYFRTMSSDGASLSLPELQVGLCALDPATPHGATPGQVRCQLIFKYYNVSGSGVISYAEFRDMFRDILIQKRNALMGNDFEQAVADNWKLFGISRTDGLTANKFLSVVGQLKFRGTSVLFRLPHSPVRREGDPYNAPNRPTCPSPNPFQAAPAKDVDEGEEKMETDSPMPDTTKKGEGRVKQAPDEIATIQHALTKTEQQKSDPFFEEDEESSVDSAVSAEPPFTIATHSVKVRRSGALTDVYTLWDLMGTEAVSGSVDDILHHHKPGFDRLSSIHAFDKTSKSNEMLSGLRYFEHNLKNDGRGKPKGPFSWGAIDISSVARSFTSICMQAIDIFASEPRLVEIKSPCYVLGDLHGNFHDLVCFEKVLWRMSPVLTPASFLFLGDYVDRGEFGFEVVAYLFAQKLLMPSKFILVRGNHEIRAVQESFTYKSECISKFGPAVGAEVWEMTNKVFDAMPIAAIIDKKIFCVHGGIPPPFLGGGLISAINDIPTYLPDPSDSVKGSQLAWEIMWNDPVRLNDLDDDEELQEELQANDGFVDNRSRGTAHIFSADALEDFLKRNDLSHVIRAHEVKEVGFQLQHNGRLLTVFSSSHYCGSSNEAACVLIDNRKIRTIRLDTRS